ncbi:MAG: hypothetical protein ACK5B9_11505 [Flavobacteriia bacterium]|jgi:hypothetical protein
MNSHNELKIRNLLVDHSGEEVCLTNLIHKLSDCGIELAKLEYRNTATALKNSKRELAEFEKLFVEFKLRIRNKITQEVMENVSARDKSIVFGNPQKLVEHREKIAKAKNEADYIDKATNGDKKDYF